MRGGTAGPSDRRTCLARTGTWEIVFPVQLITRQLYTFGVQSAENDYQQQQQKLSKYIIHSVSDDTKIMFTNPPLHVICQDGEESSVMSLETERT